MTDAELREWLRELSYRQLLTLGTLLVDERQRRRDEARPADTPEMSPRGRGYVPTAERS